MLIKIDEKYIGQRLDKVLADILNISRSKVAKINLEYKLSYIIPNAMEIEIDEISSDDSDYDLRPIDMKLDVVYEDEYLAIINKKDGIIVHPSDSYKGISLVNGLKYRFKTLSFLAPYRPGIVHRLDKDTSGLIVIAKDNLTHEKLKELFKTHNLKKEYLTILKGNISKKYKANEIDVRTYIGRDKNDRKKISSNTSKPRLAISKFFVIACNDKYSFCKVEIKTGRTHQIRVQAKELGYPVLNDATYGTKKEGRQLLHAYSLSFIHPITQKTLQVYADIPKDIKKILDDMGVDIKNVGIY